jgi:radical SAM protein with 4Fe4S-binding SPASM domain
MEQPNMSIEDFSVIAEQCNGRVNQFALGGRGDPDQHEHFEEILKLCRINNIIPNYTTSGYRLSNKMAQISKKYCGAVAVSWYRSEYTFKAVQLLISTSVKTNIHFVLGKNSIDEAITRLKKDDFPMGINAVIFLLHKPVGLGVSENVLSPKDQRVAELFSLIDRGKHRFKVGMDSCCVPGIVNFCHNVIPEAIDTCEAARFSCYISPDMVLLPCSFDQPKKFGVSLRAHAIEEAWISKPFDDFRKILGSRCPNCIQRENCMGGCPLLPEIILCDNEIRTI